MIANKTSVSQNNKTNIIYKRQNNKNSKNLSSLYILFSVSNNVKKRTIFKQFLLLFFFFYLFFLWFYFFLFLVSSFQSREVTPVIFKTTFFSLFPFLFLRFLLFTYIYSEDGLDSSSVGEERGAKAFNIQQHGWISVERKPLGCSNSNFSVDWLALKWKT